MSMQILIGTGRNMHTLKLVPKS